MRRLVAIGILSALLVLTATAGPAAACGCGGVVAPADSSMSTSHERAIISWDGEQETVELMFDLTSDSPVAGLIIPTPTPAVLSGGDPRTFELIENVIAPTERLETDWWGLGYLIPDRSPAEATVLERVQVDAVEAVTLAASDSAGLVTWLATNGFVVTGEMTESFAPYIELGWSFTAVRLTGDEALDGHVDPLRLTFFTDRLVYPIRLAQSESTPQNVRLYVFDSQRTTLTKYSSPTRELDGELSVVWAGETSDARLTALGAYLTVFDVHYEIPEEQITSDIGVVYSLNENDVRPEQVRYRMVTLLGIPVGTLLVVWTLLGVGIAFGHVIGRRRAR